MVRGQLYLLLRHIELVYSIPSQYVKQIGVACETCPTRIWQYQHIQSLVSNELNYNRELRKFFPRNQIIIYLNPQMKIAIYLGPPTRLKDCRQSVADILILTFLFTLRPLRTLSQWMKFFPGQGYHFVTGTSMLLCKYCLQMHKK